MKTLLGLFFLFFSFFLLSCQQSSHSQTTDEEGTKELMDTTPKATAIFWIDKSKDPLKKEFPIPIRSVKTKVDIDSTGKVEILSYVKPQDGKVRKYIQHRMKMFRVSKIMLDSGFVKAGEQYVQLRYMPEKMPK
ncbi:DUF4891 domain-containing protein [Bacteroides helcogenes]|uniref:DUF4891 domain-containing protein n=1 Tax=Bacteroides helcogenes (strain ATCC 35417 / DSM 20613 / JCM 6297 / CCUG 15421 / P 36-108) TaxID=693979 RepID=E6STN1_BACT6|nr:DUF4891 domain-containing protein [Bacteroides helcogenes]ADV44278.1 hypothetical protein Bache_2310 [Bacteroides helcogenes P 36-108]MDY5238309.1 DUF4891 domain-containing protein [Bacteroides helcogenes]